MRVHARWVAMRGRRLRRFETMCGAHRLLVTQLRNRLNDLKVGRSPGAALHVAAVQQAVATWKAQQPEGFQGAELAHFPLGADSLPFAAP